MSAAAAVVAATLFAAAGPKPSTAPSSSPPSPGAAAHLAKGRQLLTSLDYDAAALELMTAATAPDATDDVRVEANLYAGVANRVIGKDADARINFRYVLLRAPQTKLPPEQSPKVQLYFEAIRQELDAERATSPPRTTSTTTAESATLATRAPAPAPAPTSAAVYGAAATCAVGVLALLVGGAGVVFAETSLADADRAGSERAALKGVGQLGAASAVGGALLAMAGGVILGVAAAP